MKKLLATVLTTALVLSVSTTSAFAGWHGGGKHNNTGIKDGDGTGTPYGCTGTHFVDADGDGICDYSGTNQYYVDADGDGICDNYGTNYHSSGGHRGGRHHTPA